MPATPKLIQSTPVSRILPRIAVLSLAAAWSSFAQDAGNPALFHSEGKNRIYFDPAQPVDFADQATQDEILLAAADGPETGSDGRLGNAADPDPPVVPSPEAPAGTTAAPVVDARSTPAPEPTAQASPQPPTPSQPTAESGAAEAASGEPAPSPAAEEPPVLPETPTAEEVPLIDPEHAAQRHQIGGTLPDMSGPVEAPMPPTQSVTINLINKLVAKGILTKDEADEMIQEAQMEAEIARAQVEATHYALVQSAAVQAQLTQISGEPTDEDYVSIPYVPEMVKTEIREQVREDMIALARHENWDTRSSLPKWLQHIRPFGDIRVRYEGQFFPAGNDNTGAFPDFNAINTGAPFDVTGNVFSPQLNTDQNRTLFRLRARLGLEANLGDDFAAGLTIGTGQSNSPVSQNQTMGAASGQGGNFSNYSIWLSRAFINYQLALDPNRAISLTVGRMNNPFFTVSPIMWDEDLAFDGVALQARYEVVQGVIPFLNLGAFPVFNTALNFALNQPEKFPSYDKYLYAIQGGVGWSITRDIQFTTAVGYYHFENIEGKLSTPYTPLTDRDAGDTDNSRPTFAQKGNTYMALRDIIPDASNDFGATNQWQYFGLATPFRVVGANARLDYTRWEPFTISLVGDFAINTAWDKSKINAIAVNNRGEVDTADMDNPFGSYVGDNIAWAIQLQIGAPALMKRWDWNIAGGYRYVGSDAVVDGFTDSEFGGGGTNLEGYFVGGSLAVSQNVWFTLRWYSATSIAGPTYKMDLFQFDINARF